MKSDFVKNLDDLYLVLDQIKSDKKLTDTINLAAEACSRAIKSGNKLMFAGNGGSAADSQHLATEFVSKFQFNRRPLSAMALTTDTSCLTAIGNDYGFNELFARQLYALAKPKDVFIGITTSGTSMNILTALKAAKELNMTTVILCGAKGVSTNFWEFVDFELKVPSHATARIQEVHIQIGHFICQHVEEQIFAQT